MLSKYLKQKLYEFGLERIEEAIQIVEKCSNKQEALKYLKRYRDNIKNDK